MGEGVGLAQRQVAWTPQHFDSAVAAYFVRSHPFSLDMPEEGCFLCEREWNPGGSGNRSFFRGFRVLEIFIGLFPYKLITLSFTSEE